MEGLDLLKKDWKKNENSFEQVSETQIYKMIHRSSSSIVKWIFIISLLEFALWSILSFCMKDSEVMQKFESYHVENIMLPLYIFGYIGLVYFFFHFFMNYKKISATDSARVLISNIINTRKKVYQYVWFNIVYGIISSIIITYIQLTRDKEIIELISDYEKAGNGVLIYSIYFFMIFVFIAVFIGFIWLFYRLIYGILLKRLYKNYEELKKIDL
ncbi:hypothetical protein J2X31_001598 [Flavobacterium arsenatis]|uniref:Beta-carotene 15,15'-monooxygenase n=1 Tax=Flavobacterium arsenatis TaxID=1484332 RepID=A0ABU1TNW5_9FLAO|nr:hypothetical protein [Flavobacterium arsenatis]MDR6967586.1 hypothetical protein [Flavobacterium arsenatis]